jgi:hypothetical protein
VLAGCYTTSLVLAGQWVCCWDARKSTDPWLAAHVQLIVFLPISTLVNDILGLTAVVGALAAVHADHAAWAWLIHLELKVKALHSTARAFLLSSSYIVTRHDLFQDELWGLATCWLSAMAKQATNQGSVQICGREGRKDGIFSCLVSKKHAHPSVYSVACLTEHN